MANIRSNRVSTVYVQPTPNEIGLKDIFTQPGHGLQPGTAVYVDTSSGNLLPAIASSTTRSTVLGIVESVNGDNVTIVYQGEITFPAGATSSVTTFPLLTGNTYYLSASVTGGITGGYNTTVSSIIKPLLIPISGYHGVVVNSLPLSSAPLVSLFTPVGSIVPYTGGGSNIPSGWLLCAGDALNKASQDPPYADLYNIIGEKYGVLGVSVSSTTGQTAYIRFDSVVNDPPAEGPGSNKNHSIEINDVFKMTWGSNQTVVQAYSATGTTHNVTFKYLTAIAGSTSFNSMGAGTEITLKALVNGEAAGYTSDKFFLPDLRGRMAIGAGQGRGLSNRGMGVFGGEETHTLTNAELPAHAHNIPLLSSNGISGSASYLLTATGGAATLQANLSSFPQAQSALTSLTGGGDDHENMSPFLTTNWIIRYRSNVGQAGIEVGPQGKQGITGSVGPQGATGATGSRGVTGYALGALHYSHTSVTNVPPGYANFNQVGNIALSNKEYYGMSVNDYLVACMSSKNSQRQAIALVRSLRNPSGPNGFAAVYELVGPYTQVNATGPDTVLTPGTDTPPPVASFTPGDGLRYYRLPIKSTLAQTGSLVEGEMYSVLIVPSAQDGANGITGATGPRGATGASVNTGLLTYYYAGDQLLDLGASGQGNSGYFSWFSSGSGFWNFSQKDYFGNDASTFLKNIGEPNIKLDAAGNRTTKQPNGVQMTIRSLFDNRYVATFYLSGNYTANPYAPGGTSYDMLVGSFRGTTGEGYAGGLVGGSLYGIYMTPLPIKDSTGVKQGGSETTVIITQDGVDVGSAVSEDGTVVSEFASLYPQTYTYPYGVSKDATQPTDAGALFNILQGTYSPRRFEGLSTEPVWGDLNVKQSFNYNISLTSQPCGGDCQGGSGYISLCDIVRDPDVGNYYTPPKATNIALAKNYPNTVIQSDVTQVVDGCVVNIFGYTGSYYSKVPVGISANYLDSTLGSTGRNRMAIDVYMNTNDVAVGNFIGIRTEYFNLTLTGSATGHQSLAGVYKVEGVTGDSVRVYAPVPFGGSGSSVFTGYITGGISGDFNRVDVYTVSMNFKDCSGFIVSAGELTLGLSSHGLPFVVSFEGTTADSQAAKAISAINSGYVEIGENMAFYGWPQYGAALYATTSGTVSANQPLLSKNTHAVVCRDTGVIEMKTPILSSNSYGLLAESGGSIHITNPKTNSAFTTAVNNSVIGLLDNGTIEIADSKANLLTNRYQTGFYFAGNSSFFAGPDDGDAGLTGATGLSSIFTGSTGWLGQTGASGATGGTGGSSFFFASPISGGEAEILFANGVVGIALTGSSSLRVSAKNTAGGPAGTVPGRQTYIASNQVVGAKTPSYGLPRLSNVLPPINPEY